MLTLIMLQTLLGSQSPIRISTVAKRLDSLQSHPELLGYNLEAPGSTRDPLPVDTQTQEINYQKPKYAMASAPGAR